MRCGMQAEESSSVLLRTSSIGFPISFLMHPLGATPSSTGFRFSFSLSSVVVFSAD